jgi:hypothetical protein
MISKGKLFICPPELSGNPTSGHQVAKQEELAKEMINLPYELFILYSKGFFDIQ